MKAWVDRPVAAEQLRRYQDDVLDRSSSSPASTAASSSIWKAQTERLLRAVANRHTKILGHMTGRQLQRRPGYEIDVEKVLRACAQNDVAVEINAHPWRLDLDWRWHQAALDFGCIMSINPDSHSVRELDHMQWASRWHARAACRQTAC